CINGISLTINQVEGAEFSVNIVPHTLKETTLAAVSVGDQVNLEVDLLARYMERLMKGEAAADCPARVTENLLKESGFI
ncbi:MAG: riboflavin synthase, partial [Methyloprofundus sp.]|nr:riboflavin synthase [Methyloprofundus sp.]